MPDVEALGDVDGGIVDHDGLARALVGASVARPGPERRAHDLAGVGGAVDKEIQIALHAFHARKERRGNRARQLRPEIIIGDLRSAFESLKHGSA